MDLKALGALFIATAVALTAWPADAAKRHRSSREVVVVKRTRVVVTRRSYLDAGTEVRPGDRKFTDYVFPPYYDPYSVVDPTRSYRYPLPDPFWLPGSTGY